MHIVFITYRTYPEYTAGMEIGTHFMASELVKLGHKATVIVTRREKKMPFFKRQGERTSFYNVYRLNYLNIPYLRFVSELFNGFIFTLRFLNKLKSKKERVILHAQCLSPAGILVALLSRFLRLPSVIYLGGRDIALSNFIFRKIISKFVLNNINTVLVVARWAEKKTKEVLKTKPINVFYLGFDLGSFSYNPKDICKARERLKLDPNDFIILFVGRLIHDKAVDVLIKAFKKVKEEVIHTKLIIIGEGPEKEKLETLTKQNNLQDDVIFLGYIDNKFLANYFYNANLFVLPSRVEPYGVVLLEAMSCGLPVIGSNVMGIAETIEDGKNGLLFEKDNVDDLHKAIIRLITDKKLYNEISKNNLEKARKFSWSEKVKELEQFYLYSVHFLFQKKKVAKKKVLSNK